LVSIRKNENGDRARFKGGFNNLATKVLLFTDLSKRHVGVSDGISASYAEAACVCLDRHHTSPSEFELRDNLKADTATAKWIKADQRVTNAWSNEIDATEFGAYALALAAIEVMRGFVAARHVSSMRGVPSFALY
jgi:hypothetical protein